MMLLRRTLFRLAAAGLVFAPLASTASLAQKATQVAPQAADRSGAYYHYGLAKMYEELATANGRQDYATQAIEEYKLALTSDPDSRMLQNGLADLYFRLGRIREAVTASQDQIKQHPDDVQAHQLLGRVYLRSLGDMQGPQSGEMLQLALKEYQEIARLKPDDLETHLLLGQLYGLNHDSAKAEAEFKEAQRIDSGSEEVALSIARLYSEQGDFKRAVTALTDVPEDDRSARMEFALAGLYDQLKQPKDAAAAYKRALDQDPDNADAKRGLANALAADGQADAAGKVYQDLADVDPADVQSLIRAADIERMQGHYEESLATLKKAQAVTSDVPELSYSLALTYDALGRYDEASKALRDWLAANDHPDGKYNDGDASNRVAFLDRLATIEREQGRTDDAVAAYKEMATLGSTNGPRAVEEQVDTLREAHRWPESTAVAAQGAKDFPRSKDLQLTYARQLADTGKLDEGTKLAEAQLSGTPDDRDVYYTLIDIDQRAKRWKDAAALLDKVEALATKPEDKVFVYYYRGRVAYQEKLFDAAEADFRKALEIDPQNAAVENELGYALSERGKNLNEALAMLQKAVTFDPQNGAYLDSLGWVYFKLGQYALAEDNLRKAVARTGTDPTVLDHLGEAYEKAGKLKLAVAEWQKAVSEYATSLPADADPADVAKVEHKLEGARVKLAHASSPK